MSATASRSDTRPARLPKIPGRGLYTEEARRERLDFVRTQTASSLSHVESRAIKADSLISNTENFIGTVEVPVGIAGPLLLYGSEKQGLVYAPLATTEGALIASASRGATAVSRSGGVHARVLSQQMMRVPLFTFSSLVEALYFRDWVRDHFDEIGHETRRVSRRAELVAIRPTVIGKMVHLSFLYETGDAAGQNMTTACTWHACLWITEQLKRDEHVQVQQLLIETNLSSDKKVSHRSFTAGRGIRVTADCFLERHHLQNVLKVTPEQLFKAYQVVMTGSIQAGMVGFNINVANVVAAIFTATGQDIACVHESSLAQLYLEESERGLYASILLPGLIVGTVGGGTHLPGQREFLEMMGCEGAGKIKTLAEIIAGFCLALDLSTLSAVASGQFALAHERFGRSRNVSWLEREELDPRFFEEAMRTSLGDESISVEGAESLTGNRAGSSILTELTARKTRKLVGFFPYRLRYRSDSTSRSTDLEVMVKVKPTDSEVILGVNNLAAMCGGRLASAYDKAKNRTGFAGCHVRELEIYRQKDTRFTAHVPGIYGIVRDDRREIFVIVQELLKNLELMDAADDISGWTRAHIEAAIDGMAEIHSIWYGREGELYEREWLDAPQTARTLTAMEDLWEALFAHAVDEFPEWFDRERRQTHLTLLQSIPDWAPEIDSQFKTLIHNDFNPRNLGFRKTNGRLSVCIYDWELATVHLPQRDLAEFLSFVLAPDVQPDEFRHYMEYHRRALEVASDISISRRDWQAGFRASMREFMVNRLAMYLMGHTFRYYPFMERMLATARHLERSVSGFRES